MTYDKSLDLPILGESEIDETHQLQVQLLEEIEAVLIEQNRESALELLQRLDDYSEAHFAAEQILMRRHSYPGYHTHVADHARLIDELRALRNRISGEDLAALPAETETIRRWLLGHIRSADRSFAAWIEQAKEAPVQD